MFVVEAKSTKSDGTIELLKELLSKEDPVIRELFAKAINLYVSPGAGDMVEREKIQRLRKALRIR